MFVKEEEFELPSGYPWYLSLADLLQLDKFKTAFENSSILTINKILWDNGLDINQKFTYSTSPPCHRSMVTNEVVCCPRYFGVARTDKLWLSKYASLEAIIHNTDDIDLKLALMQMSKEGFSSNTEDDNE